MRILCAEDNVSISAGLQAILEIHNHEVVLAETGPAAVAAAAEEVFDVLLTDLDMPGYDGLEVICRVRAQRPGLPVVILSARSDVDSDGLPPGPMEVLRKPADVPPILAALARVTAAPATGG